MTWNATTTRSAAQIVVCAATVLAVAVAQGAEPVSFSRNILPLLSDRCFHCHGPDASHRQADLRLDVRESALETRGEGAVVVPGDAAASELIARITSRDELLVMPPRDSHRKGFTAPEIALLKRWIDEGAEWGKHWAFERPVRAKIPVGTDEAIDYFIAGRLETEGLSRSPEADKATLIRRVSLDLIGLPPTPDEVACFVADDSPQAYEKLVDRLLASPHYGERMAWPWLDAARYADTAGYQGDPVRTVWPFRDWVVDALNANMPFDVFTIAQLAGDLLPNATAEQQVATAFNRLHMYNSEGGRIPEETRVENVFDRAETTATTWLGLTLQCARCHDHKFDPTTNKDYFAFYDFFNQTSENGANNHTLAPAPKMTYVSSEAPTRVDELQRQIRQLESDRRLEEGGETLIATFDLPGADARHIERLQRQLAVWEVKAKPHDVMIMDDLAKRRDTFVLSGGVYDSPTEQQVSADVPSMLPPISASGNTVPSRLDLARWIVAAENPLTARVVVNRYWQTFFGQGLVSTPGDFGLQGSQPTHPELLDWLAVEFVESGWNVKHLHRLIVTSATYRQTSATTPELIESDPDNLLLARAARYRMPSWMIRDHALAVSGLLDTTIGGPPVNPYQPSGLWAEATFGKIKYKTDEGSSLYRRSLYTFWRRILGPPMFFDAAKRQTCEVEPNLTNTPLHALTTLNDTAFVEAARVLAERLIRRYPTPRDRIAEAFQLLVARDPTTEESELLVNRVNSYVEHYRERPDAARELLSIGDRPTDESIDGAELATYTLLMNTLFNLDEVLVRP